MAGGRNITITAGSTTALSRKVMVVVDPTRESAAALQYALSHALIDNDEVILLHVDNPNSWKNTITTFLKRPNTGSASDGGGGAGAGPGAGPGPGAGGAGGGAAAAAAEAVEVDFLDEMKQACKIAHPKLKVRASRVDSEGKDKATMIISQSKTLGIDLLIIGQRRSLSNAILGYRRTGGGAMKGAKMLDTAEYLIENSKCTCVAVQKKGQNAGYLLNTKTHRNFWLLA